MRIESFMRAFPHGAPYKIATRWQAEPVELAEEDMRAIAAIFVANWLEQFPRMRAKSRAQRIDVFRKLGEWIGGAPGEAIREAYGFGRQPIEIQRDAPRGDTTDQDKIEIWDDAVPSELQVQIAGLMDLNIWRYGWKASQEQTSYGFWHSHFGGDDDFKSSSCEHDLVGRPLIKPVLDLWRMLEAGPLQGHVPVRAYANGHTFGGDGHLHRDHNEPGHYTTIYYAHPAWEPNWAGETVFFNQAQDDIIRAVYPKPGRLVHFPGYIMHAARSPGRECSALRAVVVLKSRLKRPDE
jgi:SM-20-related protein